MSSRLSTREHAGNIDLGAHGVNGPYHWTVMSDCGVVKLYSSRDGCMVAMNPARARRMARDLLEAVDRAADMTEMRSYGEVKGDVAS